MPRQKKVFELFFFTLALLFNIRYKRQSKKTLVQPIQAILNLLAPPLILDCPKDTQIRF